MSKSEKRLKERTDEHLSRNLSGMTREAEEREREREREKRLRADLEQLRSQQEQTIETLDTRIDAMIERFTQTITDRLNGLLGIGADLEMKEHTRERLSESRD